MSESLDRRAPGTTPAPPPAQGVQPPDAPKPSLWPGSQQARERYPAGVVPVQTPEEAEKLSGGTQFIAPDGKVRVRPYDVTDDTTYGEVPLGGFYREHGETRRKPEADGTVNTIAQTLYDMAKTPEGKREALEFVYGSGAVEMVRGEPWVVTSDGKRLSPKASGLSRVGGFIASGALPALGGAAGSLAAIPSAAGGPVASVAGGVAGAAAGSAAGELANQQILQGLGVEHLSAGERAKEAAIAGAVGGAGQGAAAVLPAVPAMARAGVNKLAGGAAKLVGAEPEATRLAAEIASEGGRVPVHSYGPEAPFLRYIMNFAKQFGYDPVEKAARTTWYPGMSAKMLEQLGVPEAERGVVGRTAAVSLEPAGEAARNRAAAILKERSQALHDAVNGVREARTAAATGRAMTETMDLAARTNALSTAGNNMRESVTRAVDQGIADLQRQVGDALAVTDAKPGDLSRWFANIITNARTAFGKQASKMYAAADEMAGNVAPNTTPLTQWAKSIVDEVPPALQAEYPREYETIARLAGREGGKSSLVDEFGDPLATPPRNVTFGDLHQLRNFLRAKIDWGDLTAGPVQGARMRLEGALNGVINDAEADPALKAAAAQLRSTDDFYRDNIRKFEDETVRGIARFGRQATAADAEELARLTLRSGNTERIRMLREMGGDSLWNQVVAADTRGMLNAAGARGGKVDPLKLAGEIVERAQSGVLAEAYPETQARELTQLANRIARISGKQPQLEVHPGDTLMTVLDRAEATIARAESMAASDPMKTLETEVKGIRDEAAAALRAGRREIGQDPLHGIQASLGGEAAARKILDHPDMIAEVERRFGPDSMEFTLIRQTYARRMLQEMADSVIPAAGRKEGSLKGAVEPFLNLSEETQQRLFPGVSKEQMTGLIRKMVLMFPSEGDGFGSSLAGAGLLLHPDRASALGLPKPAQKALGAVPHFVGRYSIGIILNIASRVLTNPTTTRFIARGLEGSAADKLAAEHALRAIMDDAFSRGPVGAAAATYGGRAAGGVDAEPPPAPQQAPDWRQRIAPPRPPGWRSRIRGEAPVAPAAAQLAAAGRGGDTQLAHVNPREMAMLKAAGGAGTINPTTGLPEFYDVGNGPNSGGEQIGASVGGDQGSGVMAAGSGNVGAMSDPSAMAAMGNAGAAMGGAVAGSVAPGGVSAALGGAGGALGALDAGLGISDQGYRSAGWLADQIAKITPGRILGGVLTGALGPIGAGLSLASTGSGILGGPTLGGTLDKALGQPDTGWLDQQAASAAPGLGEDYRLRPAA